jgi:hypothetical protein
LCQGSADLVGIVQRFDSEIGVFLAIETKRAKNSAWQKNQAEWLATVRRMGGVAGVARTMGDALSLVAEARGLHRVQILSDLESIVGGRVDLG